MIMVEVTSWKIGAFFLLLAVVTHYIYQQLYSLPLKMEGYSDQHFRDAAQAFRRLVQNEDERGASFVAYHRGQKVLEMLGGYADPEPEIPWTSETVTQVFSLSSLTGALSLLHLSQSGLFNHSLSLKEYWPEFKEDVSGTELLQNKNQLYTLAEKIPIRDVMDNVEKLDGILQDGHSYTALEKNYDSKFFVSGLYLDAVVRRVDPKHRPIRAYFHEEFAHPLALDALVGLPKTQYSRAARTQFGLADGLWTALARFDVGQVLKVLRADIWWQLATEEIFDDYKLRWSMRPDVMEVGHPSLSLFTNARSLARLFAMLAGRGTLEGRKILDAQLFKHFLVPDAQGYDRVLTRYVAYNREGFELRKSPARTTLVGFYGFGGQMVFADLEKDLAFAYTTNYLHSCSADREWMLDALVAALYSCVEKATKQQ